jgi:glycosyltransferase involved in cell wall biosynthesis
LRIIYLTYDGLTDPLGQSQILPYLSGLVAKGFSITVISCEKKDRLEKDGPELSAALPQGLKWIPVIYNNFLPIVSPLLTLRRLYRAALTAVQKDEYKLVHCRSTLPALAGYLLKRHFYLKLVYDMRGFWADERVEGNIWKLNNPVYRFIYKWMKKKENLLLHSSDYVISLTSAAKEIMEKQEVTTPITVIPCCADFAHFNPARITKKETETALQRLGIKNNEDIIIYTGSIGTWYLLDEMMEFFSCYLKVNGNSIFLLVTREDHKMIDMSARKYGIPPDKIRYTAAGRMEMPVYLSLAKAALYFIRPGYSKKASSPVKQGESLAMGLPVITNKGVGDSDLLIGEHAFGFLVDRMNSREYIKVAREVSSMQPDKSLIRNNAEKLLSLEKGISIYNSVYRKCLNDDISHS